jgi:hypothetical protein
MSFPSRRQAPHLPADGLAPAALRPPSERPARLSPTPWSTADAGDHMDIVDANGARVFAAVNPELAVRIVVAVNAMEGDPQ